MRGELDNSVEWLRDMPSSVLSTEGNAAKFADALHQRTGVPWNVKLVPPGRINGGGFFVAPTADRLRSDGKICSADWNRLEGLFGAIRAPSCRWYLLPDELVHAFSVLNIPLHSSVPRSR